MVPLSRSVAVSAVVNLLFVTLQVHARCRNQPGGPGYSSADWSALNDTIDGRLINVVPSAKACLELGCTEAQWESGVFRQTIPGSMNAVSLLPESLLGLYDPFVVQLGTGNTYPSEFMVSIHSSSVDMIAGLRPSIRALFTQWDRLCAGRCPSLCGQRHSYPTYSGSSTL